MKWFLFTDTDGLDSASQRNVAIEQKKFITALYKHVSNKYDAHEAAERYSSILLRIPTIRVSVGNRLNFGFDDFHRNI